MAVVFYPQVTADCVSSRRQAAAGTGNVGLFSLHWNNLENFGVKFMVIFGSCQFL
jgi:hypothetical protein